MTRVFFNCKATIVAFLSCSSRVRSADRACAAACCWTLASASSAAAFANRTSADFAPSPTRPIVAATAPMLGPASSR